MLGLVLNRVVGAYSMLIVLWAVLSWIPAGGIISELRSAMGALVEPYISIFRRFMPPVGGIDFSPLVAIIALNLVQRLILYIL